MPLQHQIIVSGKVYPVEYAKKMRDYGFWCYCTVDGKTFRTSGAHRKAAFGRMQRYFQQLAVENDPRAE